VNASQLARQAYAPTSFPLKSERAIEAQIVGQVTARLRAAAQAADTNFPAFVSALHDNRRMWVILATDVADTDNGLTKELRAQIFYLAEFTDHHTAKVLRGEADSDALIEVNTAVLRGLNAGKGR
jgi:flagellar protein FlaF